MTDAITKELLYRSIEDLNTLFDSRTGYFVLDGAYGGWRLEQVDAFGSISHPCGPDFRSKRSLWEAIAHFKSGVLAARASQETP